MRGVRCEGCAAYLRANLSEVLGDRAASVAVTFFNESFTAVAVVPGRRPDPALPASVLSAISAIDASYEPQRQNKKNEKEQEEEENVKTSRFVKTKKSFRASRFLTSLLLLLH